ncbi:hypothetical protein MBLNU459_g5604t1 [Dothideomycetes sp. NU459]
MSENIPESIPTSHDRRSFRPQKRQRTSSPTSQQAHQLSALFANPDKPVELGPTKGRDGSGNSLAPPEIVANVQGSSAGAGSGEFHVYKASRRREYERLRVMDEEKEREEAAEKFERERAERERLDEERTRRKREKRQGRRGGAKGAKKDGGGGGGGAGDEAGGSGKLKANVAATGPADANGPQGTVQDATAATAPEEVGIVIHDED